MRNDEAMQVQTVVTHLLRLYAASVPKDPSLMRRAQALMDRVPGPRFRNER